MYIIFSDVDGTIYDEKSIITDVVKRDVAYAKSKGYEFVIATGNPVFSKMHWLMEELGVNYIVSSNGAGIYDKNNNKYIHTSFIPGEKINKIMLLGKKHNLFCDYWDKDKIYVSTLSDDKHLPGLTKATIRKNHKDLIVLSNEDEITPGFKIEAYGDSKNMSKFYKQLLATKMNLQIAYMSETHIEITNTNINKASGIKLFLQNRNIDITNCMTIGDSANDATMLAASNHSYAMGNAPDNIKKIAKYVTKDVNNNGVGYAIRDYVSKTI